MNSPIFESIRNQMRESLSHSESGMRAIEQEFSRIIAENKDALVSAWVAETGNLHSEGVICSGYRDGHMRIWVETKDENGRRAVAAKFPEEL